MRRHKYTIQEVKNYAVEKKGRCLSDVYKNNKTELDWECEKGHRWKMSFKPILNLGNWCPYCSGRHNNNIKSIKEFAIKKGGKCLSNIYQNNKTNLLWQCGKCKHDWEARLDRVKSGTWCPNCRRSHGEEKIAQYLKSKNIDYKQEHALDKLHMRFDFYLPHTNTAIEFDGIQHFQVYKRYTPDIETLEKRQGFDVEKTLYCLKNDIKLIRIHYMSLNYIDTILEQVFRISDKLIFTAWSPYNYIMNKIPKQIEFLMLQRGSVDNT